MGYVFRTPLDFAVEAWDVKGLVLAAIALLFLRALSGVRF